MGQRENGLGCCRRGMKIDLLSHVEKPAAATARAQFELATSLIVRGAACRCTHPELAFLTNRAILPTAQSP